MPSLHSFVIRIDDDWVTESALRAERDTPNVGYVLEAPYLDEPARDPSSTQRDGFWTRLFSGARRRRRAF